MKTQQFSNPKKTQQFSTLFANVISKPLLSESSAVDLHPHLLADGSCDGAVDLWALGADPRGQGAHADGWGLTDGGEVVAGWSPCPYVVHHWPLGAESYNKNEGYKLDTLELNSTNDVLQKLSYLKWQLKKRNSTVLCTSFSKYCSKVSFFYLDF